MNAGDIRNREVAFAHKLVSLTEAASLMRGRRVCDVPAEQLQDRVHAVDRERAHGARARRT